MNDNFYGELSVIPMRGSEDFAEQVDNYLKDWRWHIEDQTFIADASCPRFSTGEGKCLIKESMRGHDVYIIADCFNWGATYKMYGQDVPMSPDDHFCDLKRVIGAIGGKARRISVIMPMLYCGRQHKRSGRESLDCA
ncbi:MAG: ribose-phosphate pyrophosphokinase-like domain-containing protein, partial [Clostridia bacterium]|nr:ribose-phosphate pyrophosphokinase-like domain-containing protein [Clostridia bacterium]